MAMRRRAALGGVGLLCLWPGAALAVQAGSGGEADAGDAAFAPFPRELTDALGRRVRVPRPPRRLLLIFPSNVELAWALGLGERVAAIGGQVRWPPDALTRPSVGQALGFSAEAAAQYRPDLVVVTPSHHSALDLADAFGRMDVPVLALTHPDLSSVLRNLSLLGQATGADAAAARVCARMQADLQAIAARVAAAPRRSVYLETAAAARGAYQTVGQGHYASDALHWAGGRNVFAHLHGSRQISAEALFMHDPEVIICLQREPQSPAQIARRPGWSSLRAVRSGRVVVLERGHKLIPGPRQIEAVREYARALHPECFA